MFRRFVFAPACRGATIKRSSLGNPVDAYAKSHVQSKSAEVADENNDESGPHWLENPPAEDEDDQPGLDNQSLWSVNIDVGPFIVGTWRFFVGKSDYRLINISCSAWKMHNPVRRSRQANIIIATLVVADGRTN